MYRTENNLLRDHRHGKIRACRSAESHTHQQLTQCAQPATSDIAGLKAALRRERAKIGLVTYELERHHAAVRALHAAHKRGKA